MKARIIGNKREPLRNGIEIIEKLDKTYMTHFTFDELDVTGVSNEEIKESIKEGMDSIFENLKTIFELICILYDGGLFSQEFDPASFEKCEKLLDKYGHDFLLKSNEINDTDIINYIFFKIVDIHISSRNNFRDFCQNLDTALDTNITELIEAHFSLMDMFLEMNLTNIENGNKPMKFKCGLSSFEEELDEILED